MNQPFTLCFISRGHARQRFETIYARDEAQANMLGEAKSGKQWVFIGVVNKEKVA